MLIRPYFLKSSANLSISALKAVTWITIDLLDLSKTTGLYFLQIFFIFSCFLEFARILNNANSLNKISLSVRLKSATLWTGTNFLNCKFICSITSGVPSVTIVILEICFFLSTSATARDSILYPLPEKSPAILARTPASLSTHTTIICLSIFPMIPSGKPHNQMILGPEEEEEISDEGKILV